jgi:hypothetical protein
MKISKAKFALLLAVISAVCVIFPFAANAQPRNPKIQLGKVCGNPQLKCRTGSFEFGKHELAFEVPRGDNVISDSEPFYAVILKTVKLQNNVNCENAVSENERLEIQKMFPRNKVFALKCSDAGDVFYTNVADNINFIAVYAGRSLTETFFFLKTLQTSGKFKGANIRKMQAGINGT